MRMSQKCKCDRCDRIRDIFQYTKYEEKWIEYLEKRKDRRNNETVFVVHRKKRGLCEECSVEVQSRKYDTADALTQEKPKPPTKITGQRCF
jgi:hypothetical protein